MELNITALMNRKHEMHYYSASQSEYGSDAGRITWENAKDAAEEQPLVTTDEQIAEVKDYFREFGAWEDDEIDAWDANEVNALLLQLIAGDIREYISYEDDNELEEYEEKGPGRISRGGDDQFYYYIES